MAMDLHPDFVDLLAAFAEHEVRYLLVGGYAVGFHAQPRATKDMDLLVGCAQENLARVHGALSDFGAPAHLLDAMLAATPEEIVFLGRPPVRVDILQQIPGVEFSESYARRDTVALQGVDVEIIALDDLIAAKLASGRPQDLADVDALRRA